MHQIKTIVIFTILLIASFSSCIEEYIPKLEYIESNKYVISGMLTDKEGYQELSISLVSSINNPKEIPLNDCEIKLVDNKGNSFSYDEYKSGYYRTWIAQSYLNIGTLYRIDITTPTGTHIVSEFEEMMECPEIDSVYFIRKDLPTTNTEVFTEGIQFYLDLDATNIKTKFFKYDIEETWEYHTDYPLEFYFDGTDHHIFPPDYSNNICWKTENIENIFILNTSNLEVNKYKKLPLHFVNNKTSRLAYGYSILINQYSLNEKNYIFWDQLQNNSFRDPSLFETQPLPVQGNLYIVDNPDEPVLGHFQISSIKTKRLFIDEVKNLTLDYSTYCSLGLIINPFRDYTPEDYPVYFWHGAGTGFFELAEECIFCTKLGGTKTKPEFWPY